MLQSGVLSQELAHGQSEPSAREAMEATIREFIVEALLFGGGGVVLERTTSFLGHRILDSTGVLELVAFLERTFRIRVNDEEIVPDNFDSIERLADYVEQKTSG